MAVYSLVIPVFNDSEQLFQNRRVLQDWLGKNWDVVVVDDGSTVGFRQLHDFCLLLGLKYVRLEENRGKWGAFREGVRRARGKAVVLCDADFSVNPFESVELGGYDVLRFPTVFVGDRNKFVKDVNVVRRVYGWFFARIRELVVGELPEDTQCPAKIFPRNCPVWGRLCVDGFAGDVEALVAFKRAGYFLMVRNVHYIGRKGSSVRVLRDGWRMLWSLFFIRQNVRSGVYG